MLSRKLVVPVALLGGVHGSIAGGIPSLAPVEVTAGSEALIGEAGAATEGTVTAAQLENRPLLRPAEVLEVVPGLIVSQHSGDGKANQYYLRGFNLDHGTDFATTVMGMPVNVRSHGHGQGYTDLNFLIPELVERMQYRKGSYAAEDGDFATAGSAHIEYFRTLDAPFAQVTVGEHGYRRGLLAGAPERAGGHLLYGLEWQGNDGPWTLPESAEKLNGVLRYSRGTRDNGWSVSAMAYTSAWSSTDQMPQRAVDAGLIDRFGSLDPSDGGRTARYSLSGQWSSRGRGGWSRASAYAIDYGLELWSNFTFFMDNPVRGDQFHQTDARRIYGFDAAHTWYGDWRGRPMDFTLGVQSRLDRIGKVALALSQQRQDYATVRSDRVDEGSLAFYGEGEVQWAEKFRSIVGLRGDFYRFRVDSDTAANSGDVRDHILSPKLSLVFGPWARTEYYANAGYGFHSNDARGVTARLNPDPRDPDYGGPLRPARPLVRAKSYELGLRSALFPGLQTTLALWRLELASELVFVGDAGITEASFPSVRSGVEWSNYWTPAAGVIVDGDVAVSRARFTENDGAGDHIPGALERTLSVGASYDRGTQWSAGARLRYFGPRPLVADDAVRSRSSTLVNAQLGYRLTPRTRLSLEVLNLFDRQASDIDYFYASQLKGEAAPVDDIHSHPAEPRSVRVTLRVRL